MNRLLTLLLFLTLFLLGVAVVACDGEPDLDADGIPDASAFLLPLKTLVSFHS